MKTAEKNEGPKNNLRDIAKALKFETFIETIADKI